MLEKPIYLSKTVWLNVITTLIAVLTLMTEGNLVPPEYVPWILMVVGILNVILRVWFTEEPIKRNKS